MSGGQARVPAWKRLGLRLKYAKETAGDSTTTNDTEVADAGAAKEAALIDGVPENKRPQKKRKLSPSKARPAGQDEAMAKVAAPVRDHKFANENAVVSSTETGEPAQYIHPDHPTDEQLGPSRKSVTFTSDTKGDDGFSAKALFKQSTTSGQSSTSGEAANEDSATPNSKKAKRKARSQAQKRAADNQDSGPPEYVRYLDLYANDKASWKFNKKKQTDLLKNIFNLDHLPAQHDQAILQYVEGLQGAAARKRVAESAEAVLKGVAEKESEGEGLESMESAEARRRAYASALKRQIERNERLKTGRSEYDVEQLEELQQDMEVAKRADNLFDMLQKELHPEEGSVTAAPTPVPTAPTDSTSQPSTTTDNTSKPTTSKRKSRKSRTKASSSDDSSSDSEDDKPPAKSPRTIREAIRPSAIPEMHFRDGRSLEQLPSGKRVIFDDDMLDEMFPKKTYGDPAVGRNGAGAGGRGKEESESSSEDGSSESDSEEAS
ncbi:uncharacterized protein LTR77_006694 [Saxophila tyrrhenica]|uniref:WKF domain-containing protein n=1 Tax=Saxophila tyrrhenica TaxID=1690608 RepID=A0AAV9P635_9PEZI|nr:hypothetical protein LTR77_006694 [Saxophila tyrrhenica]